VKANDFLSIYKADGLIKTVAEGVRAPKPQNIRVKGLSGSLDAVLLAAAFKLHPQDYLVVLQDREEAAYIQNDLQNLLDREVLLFPMSYKRAYEYDETENANILMRAEI
jgi:transcription-repair coupling factor (superfamily II helicase)